MNGTIELQARQRARLVDAIRDAARWRYHMAGAGGVAHELAGVLHAEIMELEEIADGLEDGRLSVGEGLALAAQSARRADDEMRRLEREGVI